MPRRRARTPGPPPPGTPAERARWIVAHPRYRSFEDGERIVAILLDGREPHELEPDELDLLALGLNWWGKDDRAFEAARLNLARDPEDEDRLRQAGDYMSNAFRTADEFATACDRCIADGLGPEALWQLRKADEFISVATGEYEFEDYEWFPGHPIHNHEYLRRAADALAAALRAEPRLRETQSGLDWVGDWNSRFAAVVLQTEFSDLAA